MTEEKWGQLRKRLLKTVGQNNFTTWIEPLEFDALEEGVAVFHVPTNFMGNYVSQNFADLILHELTLSGEPVQRLAFKVPANSPVRPVRQVEHAAEPFVELSSGARVDDEQPQALSDAAAAAAPRSAALRSCRISPSANPLIIVVGMMFRMKSCGVCSAACLR